MHLKYGESEANNIVCKELNDESEIIKISDNISLSMGNTYICTIEGSDDSSIIFKPGKDCMQT